MRLILERFSENGKDTLGILFERVTGYKMYSKNFQTFVLEDEERTVKVFGETRIPEGVYEIKLRTEGGFHQKYLEKFGNEFHKGMLWLQNVPNFEYVLIHIGNTDDDTAGCLLVGDGCTENITKDGQLQGSTSAYKRLYPIITDRLLDGEQVFIEIKNVVKNYL